MKPGLPVWGVRTLTQDPKMNKHHTPRQSFSCLDIQELAVHSVPTQQAASLHCHFVHLCSVVRLGVERPHWRPMKCFFQNASKSKKCVLQSASLQRCLMPWPKTFSLLSVSTVPFSSSDQFLSIIPIVALVSFDPERDHGSSLFPCLHRKQFCSGAGVEWCGLKHPNSALKAQ